jgi:hypothetical protein
MEVQMAQRLIVVGLAVFLLLSPGRAFAQGSDGQLSNMLNELYTQNKINQILALGNVFNLPPTFNDAFNVSRGNISVALNRQMATQIASFPLGSSAAGFTWTFVPTTATFERSSDSFGPTFVERALTIGAGKFNVGVNYQHATFDKLYGVDLRDGGFRSYTGVSLGPFGVFFEDALDLNLTADTVGIFANYGVTDRLDIGTTIPIMRVKMDASLTTRVGTTVTGILTEQEPIVVEQSGSASGIGDVIGRVKYNFLRHPGGGLAAGVDFRFPTGDELNLLGLAGYQSKFYVAASGATGRLAPHFNFGYTMSGESEAAQDFDTLVWRPNEELSFAGGVDVAVTPRLTMVGDMVGRTIRDTFTLDEVSTVWGPQFTTHTTNVGATVNQMLGTVGVKFSPGAASLISGSVLFPLNEQGLTDNLTWVVGVDLSF